MIHFIFTWFEALKILKRIREEKSEIRSITSNSYFNITNQSIDSLLSSYFRRIGTEICFIIFVEKFFFGIVNFFNFLEDMVVQFLFIVLVYFNQENNKR